MPNLKFNAFGRVLSHSNINPGLRKLVRKVAYGARDCNTEFELGQFFDDIQTQQQDARLANLVLHHLPRVRRGAMDPRALQRIESELRSYLANAVNSQYTRRGIRSEADQLLKQMQSGRNSYYQVWSLTCTRL